MSDLFENEDLEFEPTEKTYGTLPPFPSDGIDDVVVIGAGIAGLLTALCVAPIRPVTILTTKIATEYYASSDLNISPFDPEILDELSNDPTPHAQYLYKNLENTQQKLNEFGCEGSCSVNTIHSNLLNRARATENIRFVEGYIADTIIIDGGFATGLMAHHAETPAHQVTIPAQAVVLATGGISSLFQADMKQAGITGIGIALAARAGARLAALGQIAMSPSTEQSLYHIGGAVVDGQGRTTVDKLWACGEAAYFASNDRSFGRRLAALETLVMCIHVADDIENSSKQYYKVTRDLEVSDRFVFMPENAQKLVHGVHKTALNYLHPNAKQAIDEEILNKLTKAYAILKPVPALGNSALAAMLIAYDQLHQKSDGKSLKYTNFSKITDFCATLSEQ